MTTDKKIILVIVIITLVGLGWWFFNETKPKPGDVLPDLGRTHVPVGTEVKYNSNPPTSGSHYEEWIKAGTYDAPRDDRNLVHSLEHGYIIVSYNCAFKTQGFNFVKDAYAQGLTGIMKEASDSATPSATLSPEFKSQSCQDLTSQLTQLITDKGPHKLIIIPRPTLDAKIAVTAWRRLEKMNSFDKKKIEDFIDGNRDQGPERTIESP